MKTPFVTYMPWKSKEDRKAYDKRRYASNVEYVKQYKLNHGCKDCGYNSHPAALEFDHILPRLRGTVASQMGKNRKCVLEEIERCELVCSNCHSIRTWKRNQAGLE